MDIERHLEASGAGVYLALVFKQAIHNVVAYDRESDLLEAKLDFALSGLKHLVELTSTDKTRNRRLVKSQKRLRVSLRLLDECRGRPD